MKDFRWERENNMDKGFLLNKAVLNNIAWCRLVCHTHGIDCVWRGNLWGMHKEAPSFYPEVITANMDTTMAELEYFIKNGNVRSVKDSYANLNLSPLGFKKFFDAEWIFHPPVTGMDAPQTNWRAITSQQDLVEWTSQSGLADVIKPDLLENESIKIYSIVGDEGISGFIINLDEGIVGVSNVFSIRKYDENLWSEIPRVVSTEYPGMFIVGYEHGEDLHFALKNSWESLGSLRVWGRSE
ncbi:hypothetical protein [Heyndrickxia camelliae]|uniref:Uncharacterized protein n=1 Tax=Heyndrickxia camelliae TaxID=1707093 RepID=A0A2N3LL16_9BACI|nr:hypothetical protein [Heyndrickxia camelliae]PKR85265.1 hypothetical protein CWO92_08695 [Heyndrickxia camelliae]